MKLNLGDRLNEPLHRARLGATLSQLAAASFHQNRNGTAELSADGEWLLTTADESAATLCRLADGAGARIEAGRTVSMGAFSVVGRYVLLRGEKSEAIPGMLTPSGAGRTPWRRCWRWRRERP